MLIDLTNDDDSVLESSDKFLLYEYLSYPHTIDAVADILQSYDPTTVIVDLEEDLLQALKDEMPDCEIINKSCV